MPRKPNGKRIISTNGAVSVRAKNANGEGSVYFVETAGAWRASYLLPGESKRRFVQARTRDLVIARRCEAITSADEKRLRVTRFDSNTTVAELAAAWLSTVARHRMRVTTFEETSKRLGRLGTLLAVPVVDLTTESLTQWQSELLDRFAPRTVVGTRTSVNQLLKWATELGIVSVNPVAKVRPPKVQPKPGTVLAPADVARLLDSTGMHRYGPVVALLFTSGLRVSEALGLSWDDVDLDDGVATVRRCVMYSSATGKAFGPPKTSGALGTHFLAPGTVSKLTTWRTTQAAERRALGSRWPIHVYEGRPVDPVFTTTAGELVSRQHIDALLRRTGTSLGFDVAHLGTHVGRRSLITALYTNGVQLDDIQHHIGHSDSRTTAGYVASLGKRPQRTASIAAQLMDRPALDVKPPSSERPPAA